MNFKRNHPRHWIYYDNLSIYCVICNFTFYNFETLRVENVSSSFIILLGLRFFLNFVLLTTLIKRFSFLDQRKYEPRYINIVLY